MRLGRAVEIVKNIHTDEVEPEEKLTAIQDICMLETHNSISKSDLIECLRWLVEEYL